MRPSAGAGLLLLLTLLAYLPALGAGFVWDDDFHVVDNAALRDLDGLFRIWTDLGTTPQYYPLTHTTFWVQYQLWGLSPFPYHLANVLLHGLSAVLLWGVLWRLAVPGAWLGAALFALHPVHVESVAWITERKNVLSGLLYLGAALAYLEGGLPEAARRTWRPWALRALAALGFGLALLAKTVTASLPIVLALLVVWKRRRLARIDWLFLIPMLLAGAAMGRLTASMEMALGAQGEKWLLGFPELGFIGRCLVAGRALVFYLTKLVWPAGLTFIYPRWEIDAGQAWQYLFPLAALAVVALLGYVAWRGNAGPLVAGSIFVVTLAPALGFFNVFPMRYSFVADHFQYLASIGPLAALAAALWTLAPRRRLVAGAVLGILGVLTFAQCWAYEDLETLWRHTLRRNPGAWMAHYNLGKLLEDRGDVDEALREYRSALSSKPDLVDAHVNLANALADRHQIEEALVHYREAVRLDPEHALAHYNLARTLEEMGLQDEALGHYREAVRIEPRLAGAHNNLAILLYRRGDYAEAWRELEQALRHGGTPHPEFVRALREKL